MCNGGTVGKPTACGVFSQYFVNPQLNNRFDTLVVAARLIALKATA